MIRSNSIPSSSSRNTVEPTIPLLLCVPCVSYARPVSTKNRSKTNNADKTTESDVNDLFVGGKTSIYEKSTVSSMLTNSTITRVSYSTAELNRFKNSLIKNSFNKKLKRPKLTFGHSRAVFFRRQI